jgi:hypothetical protein
MLGERSDEQRSKIENLKPQRSLSPGLVTPSQAGQLHSHQAVINSTLTWRRSSQNGKEA